MHNQKDLADGLRRCEAVEGALIAVTKGMAMVGGIAFLGLVAMSLVSIVGRKLGFGSVTGDIELMQAGTAVAAAAFLPYCTMRGEHLRVEFFTEGLQRTVRARLDGIADLLLALIAGVLAWRTVLQAISLRETGDVTTLVSLPLWMPVAALVPSLVMTGVCAGYRAAMALMPSGELLAGATAAVTAATEVHRPARTPAPGKCAATKRGTQ